MDRARAVERRRGIVFRSTWSVVAAGMLLLPGGASARPIALPPGALTDDSVRVAAMPEVAKSLLELHAEPDSLARLGTRFRLRLLSGDAAGALATLRALRALPDAPSALDAPVYPAYEIYAVAKAREAAERRAFDACYADAFREVVARLDDLAALELASYLETPAFVYQRNLRRALNAAGDPADLALERALSLSRSHLAHLVDSLTRDRLPALIAAEHDRRYETDDDVLVRTPDGATLSATVVRRRGVTGPLPTALLVTIYTDTLVNRSTARAAAARGYVGVVGDTRGKRLSPDPIRPYEHEVDDTHALIDWIARQPWSNGAVGMYGGSYSGFAAWAATKRRHPALRTIVAVAAGIPGLGLPMENNVFLNANYGWAFYVANDRYLDAAAYGDRERWSALNERWYASGRPYREIDAVDGTPNPHLQRWLAHPAYDAYWQRMVPYGRDFARIDIPVLTITGYYDPGQVSALHYRNEHLRHRPNAEHVLLIGPYDHFGAQASRKPPELNGYALDPVAQFDTPEITFQWLDHVLKGGPRPELLADRVNYQVMGANRWRHAPSVAAMRTETLRLHLTGDTTANRFRLAAAPPASPGALRLTANLADRGTSRNGYYPEVIDGGADALESGLAFVSDPFEAPVEVSGAFGGRLRVTINKRDFDLNVVLYELKPDGTRFHLSYFVGRASHAKDMTRRRLLTPGKVETIPFERTRMVSRQLEKGSRLLVVFDVNQDAFHQVNHGTGRDVSDESAADAGEPLELRLHGDSYVEVPIRR